MKSPEAAFANIARDLIGLELTHIWLGHGTALFLEFGPLSERRRKNGSQGNNPLGQISVGLEFDWRIERDGLIACGSGGDRELWPDVFASLLGRRATAARLFGAIPELQVELDEVRLLTIALDEDGPQWALTDNRPATPIWVDWRDGGLRCDDGKVPA